MKKKKKYIPRPKSDFEKRLFKRFEESTHLNELEEKHYRCKRVNNLHLLERDNK